MTGLIGVVTLAWMPQVTTIRRAIPLMLLAGGLGLDLLLIRSQVESAIAAAACFER